MLSLPSTVLILFVIEDPFDSRTRHQRLMPTVCVRELLLEVKTVTKKIANSIFVAFDEGKIRKSALIANKPRIIEVSGWLRRDM
jgi:hypothetical protein